MSETRDRFFEWGAMPPAWVVFLIILPLLLLFVSWAMRRELPAGGTRSRWFLGAFRLAVLASVLAILAQPAIREILYRTRDPQIVVLADDSLSMRIADKYSDRSIPQRVGEMFRSSPEAVERLSRYELVGRLLRDREIRFLESLRERGRVEIWAFSGSLKRLRDLPRLGGEEAPPPGEDADPGEILPELEKIQGEDRVKQTRLGDALSEVVGSARGPLAGREEQEVASIIVFTDGQQTFGALQPEDVARKLGQRGTRIYPVGMGNPDRPKDVRVMGIDSSDVVLVGDQVGFDASLLADGFEGERVRVDLLFEGEVVDTEYATLEGRGERQSVHLEHIPRAEGDFTVTVRVEPSPGELFEENNVAQKPIRVLDQKIRVLYLEGPPRWEYRFLKNALIRDPTMAAQVYLYSADRGFIQESSPGVLPLREFPGSREQLFQYHVVILGDVDQDAFRKGEMELLKDFVSEAGGGVVFIAGENANPARYLDTPLYALLPVEVPEGGRGGAAPGPNDSFNAELTGVGREHPVLRLDTDPERNRELWENRDGIEAHHLPPFFWFAEVNRQKPGAVTLAVNPRRSHPAYGPRPILAFQNLGKGRTFFSAVDNTWRWRAGVDNLYFYKLWGQVIRFTASGRLLGKTRRYTLSTDKLTYIIGDKVGIDARVYDANMKPSTEEEIRIYHQAVAGTEAGQKAPEPLVLRLKKEKGPGSYEGELSAEQLGRHEVWIGTETERLESKSFTVEVPALEYRDTRMDRERLKRIAEASGGQYHDFSDVLSLVKDLGGITKPKQTAVDDRQDDLWDHVGVLFLLTVLLSGEWIYRKMLKLL